MQNGILMMVDVEAVLAERSATDNVYLVDNSKSVGSLREGTSKLTSTIGGALSADGSQIGEGVMNWLAYSIAAPPPTLPKSVFTETRQDGEKLRALVAGLKAASDPAEIRNLISKHEDSEPPAGVVMELEAGRRSFMPVKMPKMSGRSGTHMTAADMSPVIVNIDGPAVERDVIFPAQYGSPDFYTEGWYWSATVDLGKTGLHSYNIHFVVFRPVKELDGTEVWKPEPYVVDATVNVTSGVVRNGFTGAFPCFLPLVPEEIEHQPWPVEAGPTDQPPSEQSLAGQSPKEGSVI